MPERIKRARGWCRRPKPSNVERAQAIVDDIQRVAEAALAEARAQGRAEAFKEAAEIAEAERARHDTGDGFDCQPARLAAFTIAAAIRARAEGERTP